ncbi:MAG: hypothetical protein WA584_22560 [Pyrinomonadaceae bacterium]
MFPRNKNRIAAAVVLTGVLALVPVAPAGAAGWPVWEGAHAWVDGLLPRALVWLGLAGSRSTSPTCGHGASIDPNGCTKAVVVKGSSIDPNGSSSTDNSSADKGLSIDPDG